MNENIALSKKTIDCPTCKEKKPLDAIKYHNECIDCTTDKIGDNIESKIDVLVENYKEKNDIEELSKEEEKGVRKWLKHALTFIKEKV